MSDYEPEQPERAEHEHERAPERITFAEAGRRLGRTADAVRMAANRGVVATVTIDGRRWVVWPQPEHPEQGEPEHERSPRSPRSDDAPDALALEVAALRAAAAARDELVDALRAEIADVRIDRDRWRGQAEQLLATMQADRVIALQSGGDAVDVAVDAAVDVDADAIDAATEPAQERPVEAAGAPIAPMVDDDTSQPSAALKIGRWLRGLVPFP